MEARKYPCGHVTRPGARAFQYHIASPDWSVSHGFLFHLILGHRVIAVALYWRSVHPERIGSGKDKHGVSLASAPHWQCDLISCMSLNYSVDMAAPSSFEASVPLLNMITALISGGLLAWTICFNQLNKAPSVSKAAVYC